MRIVCLCIFAFGLFSCSQEVILDSERNALTVSEESRAIYQQIDPSQIDYLFNAKRGHMMKSQMESMAYPEKLNLQLLYIKELLRQNEFDAAMKQVEEANFVIADLGLQLPSLIRQKFLLLQAVIYLRKGEVENCISNHHQTSCIVPFSDQAIHKNVEGSEGAIRLLERVLKINDKNAEAIWLLNIAYETLGRDKNALSTENQINFGRPSEQAWKNIATNLGIDAHGLAGGVLADDFNNDGTIDLIISSWGSEDHLQFFANYGARGFVEESQKSGLDKIFGGLNLNHADYNNDGFLDVFVMRGGWFETQGLIPNSLLRNNGDGTFTDVTKDAGVYSKAPTQSSVWVDLDLDGWLDLFVANESSKRASFDCELYHNNGDGTFANKILESGFTERGWYKSAIAIKLDDDKHKSSIFLSDFGGENKLLQNNSVQGKILLEDVSKSRNISYPISSFSCMAYDYDNDGMEDIFVSGYGSENGAVSPIIAASENYRGRKVDGLPVLYRQQSEKFVQQNKRGLDQSIYTMGCNYGDLDQDGYLDMYLATGDPAMSSIVPNVAFRNDGSNFTDVSFETGLGHLQKGHGVAFADFDQDGDQDIYTVLGGAYEGDAFYNAYFENPAEQSSWLHLRLVGVKSTRKAIGARVEIVLKLKSGAVKSIYRTVSTGSSFGGNSLDLEIGLGKEMSSVDKVIVHWPFPNSVDEYNNLEPNNSFTLREGGEYSKNERDVFQFPAVEEMNHQHHH